MRGKRPGWGALLLGNLGVFLLLVSGVALGLEGYYRFFVDESAGDNRTKVSRRWFERHWVRNQLGVRDVLAPHWGPDLLANPNDAHPSPSCHALAADAIERFLDEQVLPAPAAPRITPPAR